MTATDIATILGSLFTGASVIVALLVYQRTEDKAAFSRIRLSLIDLQHTVQRLDRLLSEPYFVEVGMNIANEITKLLPAEFGKDDLVAYISDDRNHNYVAQAIHLGRLRSTSIGQVQEAVDALARYTYEFREQLPLVAAVLRSLLSYIIQSAQQTVSPSLFNKILGNPQLFNEMIAPELSKVDDQITLVQELSNMISLTSDYIMQSRNQGVFDQSERLLITLIGKFAGMSDAELRAQSKGQRQQTGQIAKVDMKTAVEDAFEYFKLMRPLYSDSEWDFIVEAKTRLYQQAHEKND